MSNKKHKHGKSEVKAPNTLYCTGCKKEIAPDDTICTHCGSYSLPEISITINGHFYVICKVPHDGILGVTIDKGETGIILTNVFSGKIVAKINKKYNIKPEDINKSAEYLYKTLLQKVALLNKTSYKREYTSVNVA